MEKIQSPAIDLGVMATLHKRFPGVPIRKPRWAEGEIKDEFVKMKVGDIVLFPVSDYNYNTLRGTAIHSLLELTMEGRRWSTTLDRSNKSCAVIRIS